MQRCSGRDELCYQVLNDEYVSHPTWASEDGGFIASKKNHYEEALHILEEERQALYIYTYIIY
jgi:histone deacetylase complex regulatory component SIN3